ncbi:MAG: GNAT family N-acetyltransferase [Gammaproteobacteria bacterium]|jgi:ribosomal protein S18 acetylase RimI-like enzyme
MNLEVVQADYGKETHAAGIVMLLDSYASDPMGGGKPLADHVKANLVNELSKLPHAFSVVAYLDDQPVGLVNCFEGFSTFACRPLINIHDVIVLAAYRGHGISQRMLEKVEEIAREKKCCKLTLEVLINNTAAQSAYRKFGFSDYSLDPATGTALFWQKML